MLLSVFQYHDLHFLCFLALPILLINTCYLDLSNSFDLIMFFLCLKIHRNLSLCTVSKQILKNTLSSNFKFKLYKDDKLYRSNFLSNNLYFRSGIYCTTLISITSCINKSNIHNCIFLVMVSTVFHVYLEKNFKLDIFPSNQII